MKQKIVFFSGKGGVGKSTSAAAFAVALAKRGERTLLISTDPAHNVGDLFQQDIGGHVVQLQEQLFALEIDPDRESTAYIQQVKDHLHGLVKAERVQEVYRQIDLAAASPGAEEAALFDRMVSIILDDGPGYDRLIFDTAPTGHTIRLLSLPELMGVWMDGMLQRRKKVTDDYSQWMGDGEVVDDPIYDILTVRKQRFAQVSELLLDKQQTAFVFVLIPERLPILETRKAIDLLKKFEIEVGTLFVNKVLPDEIKESFFLKRKQQQDVYVKQIEQSFSDQQIVKLPLLAEDIHTFRELETLGEYMRGAFS